MSKASSAPLKCPCGSNLAYTACCAIFHGGVPAPTAEALMRSRYTAYVLKLEDYLLATWHPQTRPSSLDLAADGNVNWQSLEVCNASEDGDLASVEFVARYKINGRAWKLHETSSFSRNADGRWLYVDGDLKEN
ncbi:YchJ family protein [Amantichitinum ursilacus]|uniref:UPF0225 protein WG78_04405 n=1 Tax=Amantichitinum ursilacus TaxID=857265 RepID=A0A0N0XN51_9NEIS|nr:YchJ family metal-binding protein [Amantichitinum ursilacus]KPC54784.1 hypothetical protein WG78_04405 [Amantichitinum ursilacus]